MNNRSCHRSWLDSSGLDIYRPHDLDNLVSFALENPELKGSELLTMFSYNHSYEGYLQVFRGNKLIQTSEPFNAVKSYMAQFD